MDSSIEEDGEEFFETLEDIASSSSSYSTSSESGCEEKQHTHRHSIATSEPSASSNLRYEIWKSTPVSIAERRQRLRAQMGLKSELHGAASPVVSFEIKPNEPDGTASHPDSSVSNPDNSGPEQVSLDENVGVVPVKKDVQNVPTGRSTWTMVRSRSDGTFSRLQNNTPLDDSFIRLVKSGTVSPMIPRLREERTAERPCFLRTVSHGHGHQVSKPPLGGKKANGSIGTSLAGISSLEGLITRRAHSYWSMFGRFRITDRHGNSLFESRCPDGGSTPDRSSLRSTGSTTDDGENPEDREVLCRIKDLDSGKEFVVNEVGRDGTWSKLKDIDTGREITLEEFESNLSFSPIVQEVLRRERAEGVNQVAPIKVDRESVIQKRRRGLLSTIKGVVKSSWERSSYYGSGSEDRDASTERSGRRSGSGTDDSQDVSVLSRPVKVHAYKKAVREFADLRLRQEIQAHQGFIWTMKFSLDGAYLATAGQDKVVKVWEVLEQNARERESPGTSGEISQTVDNLSAQKNDVKKGSKNSSSNTSTPPKLFMLSESAKCNFRGHTEDVLDLCWSSSQLLLSSSMDKTVRLWSISSKGCLKIFPHNDYVTCIQFHPLDDGRFISGSLDGKVRIWSIKEPQVVDWVDLREMVTAACYTPNGQGALVGSYKGTCRLYKTSGNKLQLDTSFEVKRSKNKRSEGKKITGFQFVPTDKEKVVITSSDSRIRVYDGTEISSKYKGFRNSKSHISASISFNGQYVICASEDSRVYIWNYNDLSRLELPAQNKKSSASYEYFSVKNVLVAISWPGLGSLPIQPNVGEEKNSVKSASSSTNKKNVHHSRTTVVFDDYSPMSVSSNLSDFDSSLDYEALSLHRRSTSDGTLFKDSKGESEYLDVSNCRASPSALHDMRKDGKEILLNEPLMLDSYLEDCCGTALLSNCQHVANNVFFAEGRCSATWPEEKLPIVKHSLSRKTADSTVNFSNHEEQSSSKHITAATTAWGLVIVTASSGGEIRTFQNYSLPVRL